MSCSFQLVLVISKLFIHNIHCFLVVIMVVSGRKAGVGEGAREGQREGGRQR